MTNRTPERIEFLSAILSAALEHMGYGFPALLEYREAGNDPAGVFAVIYDRYEERPNGREDWKPKESWRVDIDTMAKGIGTLRRKYAGTIDPETPMAEMFRAERENDAGALDVNDALAILEAGVFGDVVYC
jgi:hypothetical protein